MKEVCVLVAGTIAAFGLCKLLFIMQRDYLNFLRLIGGKTLLLIPATIFVPIHELSHLLMAWICGHKVHSVTLFNFNDSGTLGSVEHSYSPSFLSHFTNMLIGLAPLLGGGGVLYCIVISSNLMFPDPSRYMVQLDGVPTLNIAAFLWQIVKTNSSYWQFWVALYLSMNVVVFSIPSGQDFKGAGAGLLITISVVFFIASIDAGRDVYQFLNMAFQSIFLPVMLTTLCLSATVNLALWTVLINLRWLRKKQSI